MTAGPSPDDAPVLDYSLGGGKILGGGTNALGRGNARLHPLATPLVLHANIVQFLLVL